MVSDPTQDPPGENLLTRLRKPNWEVVLLLGLLVAAVFTRFYQLEPRVMSHDESLHTYYSWNLYRGAGYQHSPMMHGPLQFHMVAASYFLFGVSDASARVPAALFSVALVALVFCFRRWLGRSGTLIAAGLAIISPYLLYYGRYVRNEAFVAFFSLLAVYAAFRYMETRRPRWLYLFTLAGSLHFLTKETAFIFTAQMMLFLALFFSERVLRRAWASPQRRIVFLAGVGIGISGLIGALLAVIQPGIFGGQLAAATLEPFDPAAVAGAPATLHSPLAIVAAILLLAAVLMISLSLLLEFGRRLRTEFPSFDLLLISIACVLPQLAAAPANILGWDPLAYQDPVSVTRTGITVGVLFVISAALGLAWDWRKYLTAMAIFYGPFVVFQTTIFTNPEGLASGLVGSLGYWFDQHAVERGSQPWYYYLLVQIPIYEFLPALGSLLALFYALTRRKQSPAAEHSSLQRSGEEPGAELPGTERRFPAALFLGFWVLTSFAAYTLAGERMPWLTVHITLPMILLSGWVFGRLFESIDWRAWWGRRLWLAVLLLGLLLISLVRTLGFAAGNPPPFSGSAIEQLGTTTGFLVSLLSLAAAIYGLLRLSDRWPWEQLMRLAGVMTFLVLALLTARSAFRAAYVNYDEATEFLVYAHAATGVKTVMGQVEELSQRIADGKAIDVGWDDDVAWPLTWYLRDYNKSHYFGSNPGREILQYPLVIAGAKNWGKLEAILGDRYHSFEHIRMWWPMQDYFNLTADRLRQLLGSPGYRQALWDIWYNRDYQAYASLENRDFSLQYWNPSNRMKLYVRKDVAALIWDYGLAGEPLDLTFVDPYEGRMVTLSADGIIGEKGAGNGMFLSPRDIAIAADGTLYVADSLNHRIQHLRADGTLIRVWGTFASEASGAAPGGTFNEPWGIAVAPDGSVYVADTWNHRVQHFSRDGRFLGMIGGGGQGFDSYHFWGPRDVAVDAEGNVLVADTGNKRIVIYSPAGVYRGEIGGQADFSVRLDEPVGLAIDSRGALYVADTWNQQIQVFEADENLQFLPLRQWDIDGWFGQSNLNKPYLDVDRSGRLCTSDPEGYRVLCFDEQGEFLLGWGPLDVGMTQFGTTNGIAFDPQGGLWLVDAENGRLLHFSPQFPLTAGSGSETQ